MARTGLRRVFNSIVLIGLAVFFAVGLTMVLPDSFGSQILPQYESGSIYPALHAAGISPPR
jgi:hypothetical protein